MPANLPTKLPADLAKFIKDYGWKNASFEVDGESYDVAVFDWAQLAEEEDKLIAEIQKRPEAEQDSAFSHANLWTSDFYAYFVDDHSESKVEEGHWLPIAVVGMGNADTLESFQEMNNEGFLAYVIKDDELEPGTIIWYRQDAEEESLHKLAPSISSFKLNLSDED
ncbi:MAG: hypothetical protein U1E10_13580 [Bdellovibrionales bacterium]|nr:hypothetical protein [Bdellovibrionales bacterium]